MKLKWLLVIIMVNCIYFSVSMAQTNYNWGFTGAEPVPGDYDGDGTSDLAVYYQEQGAWYIYSPAQNSVLAWNFAWGFNGSEAVPGDYDGDGTTDLGVYSPESGNWYVCSLNRNLVLVWGENWGESDMKPVPADYDGDGICDIAVYYPPDGSWYINQTAASEEVTDMNELAIMYSNAVVNASNALPNEIYKNLTSITADNTNLVWRTNSLTGTREVKIVSFMSYSTATNYYHEGETTSLKYTVPWVTVVPEMKNFCANYKGTNLVLRIKKLLGLPATCENDTTVECWVDPAYLVRPSPDPESTDCEAEVNFRTNSQYVCTSTNYINWFESTIVSRNYDMTNGVWNAYPWTRLGYTYDWALPTNNIIGLSEFIIPGKTMWNTESIEVTIEVIAVTNVVYYGNAVSPLK